MTSQRNHEQPIKSLSSEILQSMGSGRRSTQTFGLVLFVGDFGNESVEVVRCDRASTFPKQRYLGNHDATATTDWGRKKSLRSRQRRLGTGTAGFAGETHVAMASSTSRTEFNCGGQSSVQLGVRFGKMPILSRAVRVSNFEESTARIVAAANSAAYEIDFRS